MPFSSLDNLVIKHSCRQCGEGLQKRGSWFRVSPGFKCAYCGGVNRLSQSDKVRLFSAQG